MKAPIKFRHFWAICSAIAIISPVYSSDHNNNFLDAVLSYSEPEEERGHSFANPGPHEPGLLLLLSIRDQDPTPEELEAFEPGLRDKLIAAALDEKLLMLARVRAVSSLGILGDTESYEFVESLFRDDETPARLRIAILWTAGHRFGDIQDRESLLEEALRESDHALRLNAVESLALIGGERAESILHSHRMAERHVAVREVLRELLKADKGASIKLKSEGFDLSGSFGRKSEIPVKDATGKQKLNPVESVR